MPVNIFGSSGTVNSEKQSTIIEGLSLSFASANFLRRNQAIDMNNKRITNLGAPGQNRDAATKEYVDNISSHLATASSVDTTDELKRYIDSKIATARNPIITIWAE